MLIFADALYVKFPKIYSGISISKDHVSLNFIKAKKSLLVLAETPVFKNCVSYWELWIDHISNEHGKNFPSIFLKSLNFLRDKQIAVDFKGTIFAEISQG